MKLEREMNNVQEKYKDAEKSYGSELLNLVVAKGYLKKLMENEAARHYIDLHAPESRNSSIWSSTRSAWKRPSNRPNALTVAMPPRRTHHVVHADVKTM